MDVQTELDSRKMKILKAIIRNYLETGEPVGSRTISKYTDLNLSSATIRNEMADLEELGYIVQPHTSAGRIPSDKGYRLYVDSMMAEKQQEVTDMRDLVLEKADRLEQLLQEVARVLAENTNYATMITSPKVNRNKIKFIQLSNVDDHHLLVVIVAEGNIVRNKMLDMESPLSNEILLKLNILLNTNLNGLAMEEITLGLIARLKEQAGIHSEVIGRVLDTVAESIQVQDLEIYTSGTTNILNYPELADKSKAKELLDAFEEKKQLAELVSHTLSSDEPGGIQVYIGSESPVKTMQDCSVVTATYDLGGGMMGTIGIVGPKRMDYENVLDNLKTLKAELDEIYHKKT